MDLESESAAMIEAALEEHRRVILVDGFNVLHAVLLGKDREEGWWKRAPRERLLEQLTEWQGGPDEIWVAFDGDQPAMSVWPEPLANPEQNPRTDPMIHSLFVESADDWIVRRARRTGFPDRVVVVSADRKVAGRARSAGCEVWSPWVFMGQCRVEKEAKEE
jgi:predicted RNA-binding protein with PIN domain